MNKRRYNDLIRSRMKDIYLEKSHMMGRGYDDEDIHEYMYDDIYDTGGILTGGLPVGGKKGESLYMNIRREVYNANKGKGYTLKELNKMVRDAYDDAQNLIYTQAKIPKKDVVDILDILPKKKRRKRATKKRTTKKRTTKKRTTKKRRGAPKNAWQAVLRRVFDKNRGKKTFKQSMAEAKKVYAKIKPRVKKCQVRKFKKCGKKPTKKCKAKERKKCAQYKYVTGRGLLLDY